MIVFKDEFLSMGTIISQNIYGEQADEIGKKVEITIKELEAKMSFFKLNSEVSELNRIGNNKVSNATFKVIKVAKEISKWTNGLFDISVASIVKLWKVFSSEEGVPISKEIESALKLVNFNDIELDENNKTISFKKVGQCVDLGGIAKGYAADKAIEIYKESSIEYGYINLGGNVFVYNSPKGKENWTVGIQDPLKTRDEYIGAVYAKNESIVTSGIYERNFIKDGEVYGHIINPITGYPEKSDFLSVTVVGKESIYCDGISTAIFLMQLEEVRSLVEKLGNIEVILITKEKKVWVSKGLRERFSLISNNGYIYY